MQRINITFSTFPSLHSAFKERCERKCISMSDQIELLTKAYLNHSIGTLNSLCDTLASVKEPSEKKTSKIGLLIDKDLYMQLKKELEKTKTRPANFFSLAMAYFLSDKATQEDYAKKAKILLDASDSEIASVVYGLKYYKPVKDKMQLVHTEYFIDLCTSERFYNYYQEPNSPFLFVLALHK